MERRNKPLTGEILLIFGLVSLVLWQRIKIHISYYWLVFLLMTIVCVGLIIWQRRPKLVPDKWNKMDGLLFEDQVVIWLKHCGYTQIRKTEYYDQGVDIIAAKTGVILGIQVKRSKSKVGVSAVRAAVAGLRSYGCTQAMVVTNSSFTEAAIRLAESNDCYLVDGEGIKDQLKIPR